MVFQQFVKDLHNKIKDVERYNPQNVPDLTKCVDLMISENEYDKDVCLVILKLFQLNPDKFNEATAKNILMKTLMVLPCSDFALAKCLIDTRNAALPSIKLVTDLGAVLESCDFATFWKLMKDTYKPSTDPNEPFKIPQEIPRLVKSVNGFEDAVRNYICRVIGATFQTAETSLLSRLLGGATDTQLVEYAQKYGWKPEESNPNAYFINNLEEKIRSRSIDEKLQFQDVIPILRNLPRPIQPPPRFL